MITETDSSLKIEALFVDGDTRTLTIKNPRSDIEESDITELSTFMQTNNIIIGDKYSSTFGRIAQVRKVSTTIRTLDI